MGILRTSIIGIKGKRTQSLIIFTIILLILVFEITGLLIRSASQIAEEDVYRQIGLRINIVFNDDIISGSDTIISDDMIDNLISKGHVTGYDSSLEDFCNPLNFNNVKIYTGIDPVNQNAQVNESMDVIEISKNQISFTGGLNIEYNERFYKGQNTLIDGDYPDQNHQGAIISEQLASENSLEIGDILSVESEATHNTTEIKIIGIYHTNLKFEILETNFMGEMVYRSSPYNIIYTNYNTVNSLKNNACPLMYLSVWLDSPQYIQAVMDEISNDETWKNFSVYDITGIIFNQYAQQLTSIENLSDYLIVLSLLFGGIILIIAMTFWGNSYMYETGLYMVLGLKRFRILLIQFLQAFMIVIAALLVSLILSPLITTILNNIIEVNYISIMNSSTVYSYYTGDRDFQQNFNVSVAPEMFVGMAVTLIIIATISVIIPFLATMRTKPKEILTGNKKG